MPADDQAWNFRSANPNHSFEIMDQGPEPEEKKDKEMLPDPEMNDPILVPDLPMDGVITGKFDVPVLSSGQEQI